MLPGAELDTILPRPRRNDSVGSFFLQPPKIGVRWPATRVDIMMPSADAERTEMKEQKKSKSLEIVEKQRALVVEKIIEDMKRDGLHWSEPYIPSLSPHNPVSGTVYQGSNRFHLGFVGYMRGFTDNRWCTFNQIRDSGWHLKKGAKAALIEKWREFSIKEENKDTGEKEVTGHYLRCVGYWNVFNASEIEGIPAPPAPEHVSDRTAAIADDLILSSRCPIVESMRYQGSAGYAPGSDRILIAPRETFLSDETFTRVLLHEMTHSTGHPSALNRGCTRWKTTRPTSSRQRRRPIRRAPSSSGATTMCWRSAATATWNAHPRRCPSRAKSCHEERGEEA